MSNTAILSAWNQQEETDGIFIIWWCRENFKTATCLLDLSFLCYRMPRARINQSIWKRILLEMSESINILGLRSFLIILYPVQMSLIGECCIMVINWIWIQAFFFVFIDAVLRLIDYKTKFSFCRDILTIELIGVFYLAFLPGRIRMREEYARIQLLGNHCVHLQVAEPCFSASAGLCLPCRPCPTVSLRAFACAWVCPAMGVEVTSRLPVRAYVLVDALRACHPHAIQSPSHHLFGEVVRRQQFLRLTANWRVEPPRLSGPQFLCDSETAPPPLVGVPF